MITKAQTSIQTVRIQWIWMRGAEGGAEGKIKGTWASFRLPLSAHRLSAPTRIDLVGVLFLYVVRLIAFFAPTIFSLPIFSKGRTFGVSVL